MTICISGIGYHVIINIQDVRSKPVIRTKDKGMGIIHVFGNLRREDIRIFIVFYRTYQRVVWRSVIRLTDKRYLEMRILDGFETAPCVREVIFRCIALQRDLHIEGINDIDIFASVHRSERAVARGRNGRLQCLRVRRYTQVAGIPRKTAVTNEGESRVCFPSL